LSTTKLFFADDHQLIREGITKMFDDIPDIKIIGTASDGVEALNKILDLLPDIVLIDISMPGLFGDQVIRLVKKQSKEIKFLVITVYDNDLYIFKTFSAGAEGFISKDADKEELISAIRKIRDGEKYCKKFDTEEKLKDFLETFEGRNYNFQTEQNTILTSREIEIIKKIKEGKNNAQIAADLFISIKTVRHHESNIFRKLNIKHSRELLALIMNDEQLKKLLNNS
jgi:two-component system response regulator NreC